MFRHPENNTQGEFKDTNLDSEFNQSINQSIRFYKVPATREKSDVLNALLDEITELRVVRPQKNRARRLYVAIGSIASAACLLLFLWHFAFSYETQLTAQGSSQTFYLPDHSKVILASDSEVKYSKLFFNREVSLTGEAYFEVQKGSKFSVKTPKGEVRVLGTKFNVSDRDDKFEVLCFEGRVEVIYGTEERQLLAGGEFSNIEKAIDVKPAEEMVEKATAPVIAEFDQVFYNKSLNEIWPMVEKHFGVTIYSNIPVDKKFTGAIRSDNVKEVIEIICASLDISYMNVSSKEYLIQSGI